MNKKRYIPLVAIGALILSLIAVFPAFGADEVSFIDPADIRPGNDGSLSDPTPEDREFGRQGAPVGLFLVDDGLNVPIRRMLLPPVDGLMDMRAAEADRELVNYGSMPDPADAAGVDAIGSVDEADDDVSMVKAHTNKIMVDRSNPDDTNPTRSIEVGDYLMVGGETVRKVTAVTTPTAVPASTSNAWYLIRPATGETAAAPTSTITLTGLGTSPVAILTTITSMPATPGIPSTLTLSVPVAGTATDIFTNAALNVTPDANGQVVLTPGGNIADTVAAAMHTVTINYCVSADTDCGDTGETATRAADLTIEIVDTVNNWKDELTLDRHFAKDVTGAVYVVDAYEGTGSSKSLKSAYADGKWATEYHMYARAHLFPTTPLDRTDNDIVDSNVGTWPATVTDDATRLLIQHRLGSKSGSTRVDIDDAYLVDSNGATRTALTDVRQEYRIAPEGTAGGYLVAWFAEKNDTGSAVTVRSQAYETQTTLVLQETSATSGEFALKIQAAKYGTATPTAGQNPTEWSKPDIAYKDGADGTTGNPLPLLPVNLRDVITLSGADTTATLTIETTAPSFTGLLPAHNTAGDDSRPTVSAQVTDSDSGLDKKNISIIFRIEETGTGARGVELVPDRSGDVDSIDGGFEVSGRLSGTQDPSGDAIIKWWVKATDNAGNVGYSDRVVVNDDGTPDACDAGSDATFITLDNNAKCDPYVIRVDTANPKLLRAETGRHWNSALQSGDSKDKTEYRVNKANKSSILVVFDEHLDMTSVSASDFEVNGATPVDASIYNVKVRDDVFDMLSTDATMEDPATGDGSSKIAGDSVLDVGSSRGYVFLRLAADLKANAEPKVELVGEVLDLAGNEQDAGVDNDANDRIAPTLTVTIDEGTRPVTMDKVNLTITSDENIGLPKVTFHHVISYDGDAMVSDDNTNSGNGVVKFVSATEYTAVVAAGNVADGLYTVSVEATDASGGNTGMTGDNMGEVDVSDDTKAVLFEHDEVVGAPDIDADKDGIQNSFETDDMNGYIRIDFDAEAREYDNAMYDHDMDAMYDHDNDATTAMIANPNATDEIKGDDLDTHAGVTIVSATLNGDDIADALQSNDAGNIFLYRAPDGLAVGEHELEVVAMDDAGNKHPTAQKATITITERKPFSLKLNPGWNLVSIPGEPADPDINVVIPADRTDITSVLAYDPTVPGLWLSASRGADGMFSGTLKNITSTRGYWVETNTFTSLPVMIPKQSPGQARVLPTIPVAKGWNMVPIIDVDGNFMLEDGNPDRDDSDKLPVMSMEGDMTRGYLDGLEGLRVYTFNTITNRWDLVNEVQIGKGYWVYASKAGIIVP